MDESNNKIFYHRVLIDGLFFLLTWIVTHFNGMLPVLTSNAVNLINWESGRYSCFTGSLTDDCLQDDGKRCFCH
jgi:hypothetical protein